METTLGASLRRYERCSGSGGMISTPVVPSTLSSQPIVLSRWPMNERYRRHIQGYPQPFQFSTINRRYRLHGWTAPVPRKASPSPGFLDFYYQLEFILINRRCFFVVLGRNGMVGHLKWGIDEGWDSNIEDPDSSLFAVAWIIWKK